MNATTYTFHVEMTNSDFALSDHVASIELYA